jgi:hypothetical protein
MWLNINPQPDWIGLCLDTAIIHNPLEYRYVTDENLSIYLPHLRPEVWEITHIVAACDYIRLSLIYEHGGLWIDADAIIMHSLKFMLNEIDKGKLFLLREQEHIRPEEYYDLGFFGAPQHNPTSKRAVFFMDEQLNAGVREFPWSFGSDSLTKAVLETNPEKFVIHSSLTHPFTCIEQDRLIQNDIDADTLVNPDAPVVVCAAEMFRRYNYGDLQNQTKEQILSSNTVIGQLFRRSQKNSLSQWMMD